MAVMVLPSPVVSLLLLQSLLLCFLLLLPSALSQALPHFHFSKYPPAGSGLSRRVLPQSAYDATTNRVWVYGGVQGIPGIGTDLNDMWSFDLVHNSWKLAPNVGLYAGPVRIGTVQRGCGRITRVPWWSFVISMGCLPWPDVALI
jgi:hypothetical protein